MGTERPLRRLDGEALFAAAERDVDAGRCRQRYVVRGGLRPRTVPVTFFGRPAAAAGLEGEARRGRWAEGSGAAGGGAKRRPLSK
jgi:hypothetical protein